MNDDEIAIEVERLRTIERVAWNCMAAYGRAHDPWLAPELWPLNNVLSGKPEGAPPPPRPGPHPEDRR